MAEYPELDLPYGHFGPAEYVHNEQRWHFNRLWPSRTSIIPLVTHEVGQSPLDNGRRDDNTPNPDASHSERPAEQVVALVRRHPELRLTQELLPTLLKTSVAVENAARRNDPLRGDLLSISQMSSPFTHRAAHVAALVSAKNACHVKFILMAVRKSGWHECKQTRLESPSLQGEEALYDCPGPPIQQVLLSPSRERNIRLAVRQPRKITLLAPIARSHVLSFTLINLLELRSTEEANFAHIAFNPWTYRQIAVIDQSGGWKIFEVRTDNVTETCKGSLMDAIGEADDQLNDGWARITWVANVSTVVACNRKHVCLFRVDADKAQAIERVDVRMSSAATWVLDLQALPTRPEYFLVLTNEHIILFRVIQKGFQDASTELQGCWRHCKSSEDLTLRLTFVEEAEDILVVLSSSNNDSSLSYRVTLHPDRRVRVEEPRFFETVKPSQSVTAGTTGIAAIHVCPAVVKHSSKRAKLEPGHEPQLLRILQDPYTRFYSITILHEDMSVAETLCIVSRKSNFSHEKERITPDWTRIYKKMLSDSNLRGLDDTIDTLQPRREPRPRYHRRAEPISMGPRRKAIDLEHVVRSFQQSRPLQIEDAVAKMLEGLEEQDGPLERPSRTLYDFTRREVIAGDIEGASAAVQRLADSLAQLRTSEPSIEEEPESAPLTLNLEQVPALRAPNKNAIHNYTDLLATYNEIVTAWITPLPRSIPARIRVTRDRMARVVAAQLMLSSHVIRARAEQPADTADADVEMAQQTWDLPVRGLMPSATATSLYSGPLSSPLALPTPSPTTTPSVTTASSRTSIMATAPEIDRLRKYVNFTKPAPPALPRALRNVLSHWTPGSDVATYDWIATSRNLSQQDEEADTEMTEKERQRLARRAQRHLRRQRKEAMASEAQRLASSQIPEIFSASQPSAPPPRKMERSSRQTAVPTSSQSVATSAILPASQPIAGRFGGRPPAKKKRKSGF